MLAIWSLFKFQFFWEALTDSDPGVDELSLLCVPCKFHKNIYFCFIDYAKAFDWVGHNKLWKILKEMGKPNQTWETYMQVRKQQLELDMEQQTGSK